MTRTSIYNKCKLLLTFIMVGLLCFSAFFFTACKEEETVKKNETTYTYSEQNDSIISNSSFSYGTMETALTSYPKTSVTGWSKKTESGMTASSAKSGVVDLSADGWTELVNNLYSDSAILNYFKVTDNVTKNFDETEIKNLLKNRQESPIAEPTENDVKNYKKDVISKSLKTELREGAKDTKVYMLNNYRSSSEIGLGTAQNITSATEITLNKGEYGKVTVYINTKNIKGQAENGAFIRLVNSFNSSPQADFAVNNINTIGAWKQYTVYVKADADYDCKFTLVLGLGYDRLTATEGTVFFDDVEFTHLTAEEFVSATAASAPSASKKIEYKSEEDLIIGGDNSVVLYDMTLTAPDNYFVAQSSVTGNYTSSNKGVSGDKFGTATFDKSTGVVSLTNSSYTLSLGDKINSFGIKPESYLYLSFYIKNELSSFGSTDITVDVYDLNGEISKKRAAVATVSETSDEFQKVGVIVKNNFAEGERQCYFNIVIGPEDIAATDYKMDFASGNVTIKNIQTATGSINRYTDETETEETPNYNFYSLYNSSANGSTALYAGYANDFSETSASSESYALTVAPSDIGTITSKPANPSGYQGIVANHFYIKPEADGVETKINTSATAGLINSKYINEYKGLDGLSAALNFTATDDEKSIQPLMIYNKEATSYGYIGASKTISASSTAKVSATVKTVGDAKAYIYLVDVSGVEKKVMTFEHDKAYDVNTDKYTTNEISRQLAFVVDKTMMNEDGWLTVEFYVAAGANAKNFRVEVWNGSRDGQSPSQGYVFFKAINVTTSSGFTEATKYSEAFTVSGNPLYQAGKDITESVIYKQELTETEKTFNAEQENTADYVSYNAKYIWAKSDSMIYAIYNSIDPVEVDPYKTESEEETEEESGCAAETDPSTFWLSFSSIILGVVLVLAIIMLFAKNYTRRRKANASDAKSHYKVTSRTKLAKQTKKEQEEVEEVVDTEESNDVVEELPTEEVNDEQSTTEQTLDEYVYGDVQDFGAEGETSENTSEEVKEDTTTQE